MFADRIVITAKCLLATALHLGGDDRPIETGNDGEIAAVARDADGHPVIAGTSLKGALRARLERSLARDVFGRAPRDEANGKPDDSRIGRLWLSALTRTGDPPDPGQTAGLQTDADAGRVADGFVRRRTRIDRTRGTADEGKLFAEEMIPAGTRFALRATWFTADAARLGDDEFAQLAGALAPLAEGLPLGRGTRKGDGRLRLDPQTLTVTVHTLSASTGELDASDDPGLKEKLRKAIIAAAASPQHWRTLRIRCDGPFISVRERKDRAVPGPDGRPGPTVLPLEHAGRPVLWASAVLGALRARCAWLAGLDHLRTNAQSRFAPGRKVEKIDQPDRVVRRREEVPALSSVERLFGVTGWRGRVIVGELAWAAPPDAVDATAELTSVSIDRFTGGGRDGALYTTQVFLDPAFSLSIRLDRGSDLVTADDAALFEALIADLRTSGLFLGHGAAKGFGWFAVTESTDAAA